MSQLFCSQGAKRFLVAATIAMAFSLGAASVLAQGGEAGANTDSKQTPRTADGHPDLNGLWGFFYRNVIVQKVGNVVHIATSEQPPEGTKFVSADRTDIPHEGFGAVAASANDPDGLQAGLAARDHGEHDARVAAAQKNPNLVPPYKPELLEKAHYLDLHSNQFDPAFKCQPVGVPRVGPPEQIVQTPGQVVFLYKRAYNNASRIIPTDGRPHRTDLDPMYFGDSVGRWEGDTLVVDVTNIDPDTWLGIDGWFHSAALHVIERLRREGNTLIYQATVEDPNVFTRPRVQDPKRIELDTNPEEALYEEPPCRDEEQGHMVTYEHH